MLGPKKRLSRGLTYATLFFFFCAQLAGCSGGGGSGGASEEDSITLSAKSLYPGQFLTISHDGLDAGDAYRVTLDDNQGYDVTIPARCVVAGSIRIQLPPYVDDDQVKSGEVKVTVAGLPGSGALGIKDTVAIAYEDGEQPGDILRWWLNEAILTYQALLDSFDSMQTDTSAPAQALQGEIDRLQDVVDEFDASGTMTLYLSGSESQTLGPDDLALVDQLLFLQAAGFLQA